MATDGIVPALGLWYGFRKKLPLEDYASFCAEFFEEIARAESEDGVVYVHEDSERARSDAVKA